MVPKKNIFFFINTITLINFKRENLCLENRVLMEEGIRNHNLELNYFFNERRGI